MSHLITPNTGLSGKALVILPMVGFFLLADARAIFHDGDDLALWREGYDRAAAASERERSADKTSTSFFKFVSGLFARLGACADNLAAWVESCDESSVGPKRNLKDTANGLIFMSYVAGVLDAADTTVRPNITKHQAAKIVSKYLKNHPEERDGLAAKVVLDAIAQAFPHDDPTHKRGELEKRLRAEFWRDYHNGTIFPDL